MIYKVLFGKNCRNYPFAMGKAILAFCVMTTPLSGCSAQSLSSAEEYASTVKAGPKYREWILKNFDKKKFIEDKYRQTEGCFKDTSDLDELSVFYMQKAKAMIADGDDKSHAYHEMAMNWSWVLGGTQDQKMGNALVAYALSREIGVTPKTEITRTLLCNLK